MDHPCVIAAHKEQLAQLARLFEADGWTQTELGEQLTENGNARLGWCRYTDGDIELRVNFVYECTRKDGVLHIRSAVLAKPAQTPPSNCNKGLRILWNDSYDFVNLGELLNWRELNAEERADRCLNELDFRGMTDHDERLPAEWRAKALACLRH
jgi:hypothetical protein